MRADTFTDKIRTNSARVHPWHGAVVGGDINAFDLDELGVVVDGLRKNSRCLRLCYASHKVQTVGAWVLTLACVNFSTHLQLSPSTCLLREFVPLPKNGFKIITSCTNIRPISIVSDIAAITDGLMAIRIRAPLRQYWGEFQYGGTHEALMCVVVIVLIRQLRIAANLETYIPFGDIAAAFDGASRTEMLAGAFEAGVVSNFWMLLDDILRNDVCRLTLAGFLSDKFALQNGAAQGRKLSVDLFNCVMRRLHMILELSSPGVAVAGLSWAQDVEVLAAIVGSPSPSHFCYNTAKQAAEELKTSSKSQMAVKLARIPSIGTRRVALEVLGASHVVAVFFVDDVAALAASSEQAAAIIEGFEQFTSKFGSAFNLGPNKNSGNGPDGGSCVGHAWCEVVLLRHRNPHCGFV